jgi:hypothetical protein
MGIIHATFRHSWTVLDDLKIGSKFLKKLLQDTVRAAQGAAREPFESRLVLFGAYENVVEYPPAFRFDNNVHVVQRADHCTVCKPRYPHDAAYFQLISEVRP